MAAGLTAARMRSRDAGMRSTTLLFLMVNEGKVIWLCSCRILLRETNRNRGVA